MAHLWTPIANAFEAYRRRKFVSPNAHYEHIWRLIHIYESVIVTLGSACATRMYYLYNRDTQSNENLKNNINEIREIITGIKKDNKISESSEPGCLRPGSIAEWIRLLSKVNTIQLDQKDYFIDELKNYLKEDNGKLTFLSEWERIAQITPNHKSDKLKRINRFSAINELRNKLAHVPISGRILPNLHQSLFQEILYLLTDCKNINLDFKNYDLIEEKMKYIAKNWHSPLCGKIINKFAYVEGSSFGKSQNSEQYCEKVYWEWTFKNNTNNSQDSNPYKWKASPFVYFDDELKVSLLFRVPNLSYDLDALEGEYHRFAAEVEPVQKYNILEDDMRIWLPDYKPELSQPPLRPSEAGQEEIDIDNLDCSELRQKGDENFNTRNYEEAIKYYDKMNEKQCDNESYNHLAKSLYGAALWRVANRSENAQDNRKEQFEKSIKLLEEGAEHIEINRKAEARYQRSKALWHLAELETDVESKKENLEKSIEDIEIALGLSLETRYMSWYEWLLEKRELLDGETSESES